jgi:hypothetical protein
VTLGLIQEVFAVGIHCSHPFEVEDLKEAVFRGDLVAIGLLLCSLRWGREKRVRPDQIN